jgi:hypothetical protein
MVKTNSSTVLAATIVAATILLAASVLPVVYAQTPVKEASETQRPSEYKGIASLSYDKMQGEKSTLYLYLMHKKQQS